MRRRQNPALPPPAPIAQAQWRRRAMQRRLAIRVLRLLRPAPRHRQDRQTRRRLPTPLQQPHTPRRPCRNDPGKLPLNPPRQGNPAVSYVLSQDSRLPLCDVERIMARRPSRPPLLRPMIRIALLAGALALLAASGAAHADSSVLTYHGALDRAGRYVVPGLTYEHARDLHLDASFHAA